MVNVVTETCACSCDRIITTTSPSPDWATETCARNWARQRIGLPPLADPRPTDPRPAPTPRSCEDPWADVFTRNEPIPPGLVSVKSPQGIVYRTT
jgi:hypothetical protein